MAKDLKSNKPEVEREAFDKKDETQEEVIEETKQPEELGTEETPADSSPEETSEKEKDELKLLKEQIEALTNENSHIKDSMQKRIDELTWQIKSKEEKSESNKEKTWDDLDVKELQQYIAYYVEEGNGQMVAYLTDKLTDKKIETKDSEKDKVYKNQMVRVESWNQVAEEYPELKDVNSEHYKRTLDRVKSDPRFDDMNVFPEGHAVAARLVAADMLKEQLRSEGVKAKEAEARAKQSVVQNSLDSSSGKQSDVKSKNDLAKRMEKAMDSKNPYGPEWKDILREINSSRK